MYKASQMKIDPLYSFRLIQYNVHENPIIEIWFCIPFSTYELLVLYSIATYRYNPL